MPGLSLKSRAVRRAVALLAMAAVVIVAAILWLAPARGAGTAQPPARPVASPTSKTSAFLTVPKSPLTWNTMLTTPPWPATMRMTEGPLQMVMLHLTGKQPTWAEISKVYAMLDAGKAATAKYRDLRVAEADGYYTAGWLNVPTQGYHYINDAYAPRHGAAFDPTKPWILVYNKVQGKMTLSGVLYGMPADSTPAQLAAVFPPSLASWHQHINLCITQAAALPIHDAATCQSRHAAFIPRTQWVVHAWFWEPSTVPAFAMDRT
jgi:hypothetical protein